MVHFVRQAYFAEVSYEGRELAVPLLGELIVNRSGASGMDAGSRHWYLLMFSLSNTRIQEFSF